MIQTELETRVWTTQAVRANVDRALRELAEASTAQLVRSLRGLNERLVSNLLPLLDAEEKVLSGRLDRAAYDALATDHRRIRSLAETLGMLSDNVERSRRRAQEVMHMRRALHEAASALEALEAHEDDAFRRLEAIPLAEQKQLVTALHASAAAAREHTMLIVRPEIPPRASTVLRKRPDLDTARVVSLAEFERK